MDIVIKTLSNDAELLECVRKFLFNQIKVEFGYGYVPEWHQDIIHLERYYVRPEKNNFFIAFDGKTNEIIATIGIRAYDKNFDEFKEKYSKETTSSIWRLFVDKKYRRCGLASKMFSIAENFANESGFENIYLHTHKTLPGALEFWTKMGFVVALDANDELQTVHMDKNIRSIELNPVQSSFNYALEI
ncbi:GNAT family N-acetyltransferase [Methanobrevibacter sp.]